MSDLDCPKCRQWKMHRESFQGIEIDRCGTCQGMFLDRGELEAMLARDLGGTADTFAFSHTSDAMDAVSAWCPRCQEGMAAVTSQGGLRVDVCRRCRAVFLDQGELASLQLERS
jgi:Zn-finger nucleic acid-binding protein